MIDLRGGRAERRHEDDGIEDRAGEQAVGAGGVADFLANAAGGRKLLPVRMAEFDAGDESALADMVDDGVGGFESGEGGARKLSIK